MADIATYISLNELMEVLENTGIIQFSDDAWISINDQYPVITGTVCDYPDVEAELMLKKHPLTYIFTIIINTKKINEPLLDQILSERNIPSENTIYLYNSGIDDDDICIEMEAHIPLEAVRAVSDFYGEPADPDKLSSKDTMTILKKIAEKKAGVIEKIVVAVKRYLRTVENLPENETNVAFDGNRISSRKLTGTLRRILLQEKNLRFTFDEFYAPAAAEAFQLKSRITAKALPYILMDCSVIVKDEQIQGRTLFYCNPRSLIELEIRGLARLRKNRQLFIDLLKDFLDAHKISALISEHDDASDEYLSDNGLTLRFPLEPAEGVPVTAERIAEYVCGMIEIYECTVDEYFSRVISRKEPLKEKKERREMQLPQKSRKSEKQRETEAVPADLQKEADSEAEEADEETGETEETGTILELYQTLSSEYLLLQDELMRSQAEIERLKKERTVPGPGGEKTVSLSCPEKELYPGEGMDLVYRALKTEYENFRGSNTRKEHVLKSIVENNGDSGFAEQFTGEMKRILNSSKGGKLTKAQMQELEKLGFEISHDSHYKLLFKGDRRYPVILGSTSSDKGRYKENMIQIVRRTLF